MSYKKNDETKELPKELRPFFNECYLDVFFKTHSNALEGEAGRLLRVFTQSDKQNMIEGIELLRSEFNAQQSPFTTRVNKETC